MSHSKVSPSISMLSCRFDILFPLILASLALGLIAGCDSARSGMENGENPANQISSVALIDQADEDGIVLVGIGNDIKVTAEINDPGGKIESVEADVSAPGASTVTLIDEDGDGTYEAAFTLGETAPEGDQAATVTVTDGNGNEATVKTNALPPEVIRNPSTAAVVGYGDSNAEFVSGPTTVNRL